MKLINIGFGNMVSAGRVVAVVSPDSAPVKRLVKEARERGMLIDASYGRSTRAVLIMDSDHVVLSALQRKRWPTVRPGRRAREQQRRNRPMEKDKFLFVVSGAAGTGKDSVVKALREAHPEIEKTVSATTRSPRPGEQEGVDYYYRTQEQFRHLIDTDQVVEYNFTTATTTALCARKWTSVWKPANWWFWSSTCTVLPTSAGCSRVLPRCSCCRRRWKNWNTPAWPRNRDRRKHPRASGHGPERVAEQDKFTLKLVNNEVASCAEELYQVICRRAGITQ